ncbi:MAG: helix-hairpin-helix domain-containing protein [Firmicutes bacterium]|nr:helix-hairpin-helix domain-containing protein [Bacillota bacterium]
MASQTQPAPSPAQPININACSQEELMALPGISVPLAMKAMAYRAENGGFESVDAFVDYLQLKPHFAVQIFERATTAALKAPPAETTSHETSSSEEDRPNPRRYLDF